MSEEQDPLIGTEIAGCKIIKKIGTGGMGSVYKAHHTMLDKPVCVKILAPNLAGDERYVQFFLREARSVARLEHPNIVQVYNVGKENNLHFLVMSYIEGKPLSDIVAQTGGLPLEKALWIFTGILKGLSAAHAQTIIHRDIKPSNILITSDGEAKIVDFGLARKIHEEKQLTVSGEMVGTAYFMAPEQGLGRTVDNRADLYSAAVTLFYMLTAKYPFDGKTSIEVIHKHISEPAPNVLQLRPDVPMWLGTIIERLMKKKPEERFQSAQETLEALSQGGSAKKTAPAPAPAQNAGLNLNVAQAQGTLKIAGTQKSVNFSTADDIREVSARVPEVISFDDLMREQLGSSVFGKAAPPPQKAAETAPKPAAAKPAAPLKTATAPVQTAARPPQRPQPPAKKPDKTEVRNFLFAAVFAFITLAALLNFCALGCVLSHKADSALKGLPFFLSPWTSGLLLKHWLMLGCGLALLLAAVFFSGAGLISGGTAALLVMACGAYAAGLSGNDAGLAAPHAVERLFALLFSHFFAKSNFLVYAAAFYLASCRLLCREENSPLGRWLGTIFAVLACLAVWRFAWISVYPLAGERTYALFYVALVMLGGAVGFGFAKKTSSLSVAGPPVFLMAALAFLWVQAVSAYADKAFMRKEQAQETAITQAIAARQAQAETARQEASAKTRGEIIYDEKGEPVPQPPPEAKKPVEPVRIPDRQPFSELKDAAWKEALLSPLKKFYNEAPGAGSYLLAALLAVLLLNFAFSRRVFGERSGAAA